MRPRQPAGPQAIETRGLETTFSPPGGPADHDNDHSGSPGWAFKVRTWECTVSSPRVSTGPAGCHISRDYARRALGLRDVLGLRVSRRPARAPNFESDSRLGIPILSRMSTGLFCQDLPRERPVDNARIGIRDTCCLRAGHSLSTA